MNSIASSSGATQLWTCVYGGKKYICLRFTETPARGFSFSGTYRNGSGGEILKLIKYRNSQTSTVLDAEIDSSLALYTTPASNYFYGNVVLTNSDAKILGGDSAGRLVVGNISQTSYIEFDGATNANPNGLNLVTSTGDIDFFTNSLLRLSVLNNGNVGVGITAPTGLLEVFTGLSGTANFNTSGQANGTIAFCNSHGSLPQPAIQGKSTSSSGLVLIGATNDINTLSDMRFDVRKTNGTDFTTLTSVAFRFQRAGTALIDVLRNGNTTVSGTISGTNLSGTNTGDNAPNSLYSDLVSNATHTGEVTGATALTITNNVVTNAKLAQVATGIIKGRITAATGNVEDLTATQVTSMLDVFTTTLKGLVPLSGGGTVNFLRADGSWAPVSSGFTNPMTTLGDSIYGGASGTATRLAGNITTSKQFLSQTGTGTVSAAPVWSSLSKTDVGLGNVDNTSDLNKPVSTATQTALDLKANLASPTFTGTPTAPTATAGTNTTQIATTAFVLANTNANAVLLTGDQTISGIKTLVNSTNESRLQLTNSSTSTREVLRLINPSGSAVNGSEFYNSSNTSGKGAIYINSSGSGNGLLSEISSGASNTNAIRVEVSGVSSINDATVFNASTTSNLVNHLAFKVNNVNVATVSKSGVVTANSFIKSGGTANQMLMADGSTRDYSTLPTYADNAAAITGGLAVGALYRTIIGLLAVRF
jgi:hypothetical protein